MLSEDLYRKEKTHAPRILTIAGSNYKMRGAGIRLAWSRCQHHATSRSKIESTKSEIAFRLQTPKALSAIGEGQALFQLGSRVTPCRASSFG